MLNIRQEIKSDLLQRDALITQCFGPVQTARSAHILRKNVEPNDSFSLVATQDENLIGSIRFYPVLLPSQHSVLMLGPLAIAPVLRGQSIGKQLIHLGLEKVKSAGHKGVIVIGDAGYFTRHGFHITLTQDISLPGIISPLSLLGCEWHKNFLQEEKGLVQTVWNEKANVC